MILVSDAPAYNPTADANDLLSILAWCATAAGVASLIVVGAQLALQLRRGEPGEGAGYFRAMSIVIGSCIIAAVAGPIVSFIGIFSLR